MSGGEHAQLHQVAAPQALAAETANRKRGRVERHGRQRGVDAAAVRQPRIDHGRAFVDPAAHAGGDPLDDPHQMVHIAEADVGLLQASEPFHVDLFGPIDEDIGDGRIGHQRRQRSHAQRLFQQVADQPAALVLVQRQVLDPQGFFDESLHEFGQRFLARRQHISPVEVVQQLLVQDSLDGKVLGAAGMSRRDVRRAAASDASVPCRGAAFFALRMRPLGKERFAFSSRCRQSCSGSGELVADLFALGFVHGESSSSARISVTRFAIGSPLS